MFRQFCRIYSWTIWTISQPPSVKLVLFGKYKKSTIFIMKKLCQESWQLWPSCSWSWSRWRWWCQCWNPVSAAPCTVGATSPNLPLGRQDGGDRAGGGGWWRLDWQWRWCSEPKTVWFVTMRMVICVHHILEIHLPMKTWWDDTSSLLIFFQRLLQCETERSKWMHTRF